MSYPQLQDVKNYLSINSTDDDFLLGLQLTQAIKIFEELTGRVFVATTDSSRTFYSDDRAIVNRRKFNFYDDICSITSLFAISPSRLQTIKTFPPKSFLKLSKLAFILSDTESLPKLDFAVTGFI